MEPEACTAIWQAHRNGEDPTAFNRLFDALHPGLLWALQARFSTMPTGDVEDAASDAFVFLATNPDRFDPARAALPGFLFMVGVRRLTDCYRKAQRHPAVSLDLPENEITFAVPQTDTASAEDAALTRITFDGSDPRDELRPEVQAWLEAVLPVARDRNLFLMTADERLTVEAFASLYEVQVLPLDEQRREMKRCRDRVQKRVQRDGAHLWKLVYGEPLPARFTARKADTGKTP